MKENTTKTTREQRGRTVTYTVFTADDKGLAELVGKVGAEAVVNLYQEFYIARNSLLSRLDLEDKGELKDGDNNRYPAKGENPGDVKLDYDLTENFPTPGSRKSKWGELKDYVASAKATLEKAFATTKKDEHDPNVEANVRRIAEVLKKKADEATKELLG
jgi:hypothetical protein